MTAENSKQKFTFKYSERLHAQKDFQKVLKLGRRVTHPAILIYIYQRSDTVKTNRLGLITNRKLGLAVKRNRLKRRLREIFRLHKHLFTPGLDIIFIPKTDSVDLNYSQLKSIILSLLQRIKILR